MNEVYSGRRMGKKIHIKAYIKYCCGKVMGAVSEQKLEYAISRAEVISFDIFDTLVKRNVTVPEHVHWLVQREFLRQTGIEIPEYPRKRIKAESEARKHTNKEEISLDDIFSYLYEVSEEWKYMLRQIERQTEIEICTPNPKMKVVYEKALQNDKRIIITSDMYLDEETIQKILCRCGYDTYEKLYLSSSYGLCKSRGSIYQVIQKDYADYTGKILHVGDNIKGDYIIPKKKGIAALLIDGQECSLKYWKKGDRKVEDQFLYEKLYCFLNNHKASDDSDAMAIGYEILGPMLFGYCKWLCGRIRTDKIDRILFLSREGKIIQETFNRLYPQFEIEQTYLYVSRQALVVPLLVDAVDFDGMVDKLQCLANVPLVDMIPDICGFDRAAFHEKLLCAGLDGSLKIDRVPNEKKEDLYQIIQELGREDFKKQKEYIAAYLQENKVMGNVAVVDIGWAGTMQQALQQYILDKGTKLFGYYLGVRNIKGDDYYAGLLRNGYLFDAGRNVNFNLMTRFTAEVIEMLFLNAEGSVLRYTVTEEGVVPVLSEAEYGKMENGFVSEVQAAALKFLNTIQKDELFKRDTEIPPEILERVYYNFAVQPSYATLKIFDGFRVRNSKVRNIYPEYGIFYCLCHPENFYRDFRESACKIFFLKKLLRVKLPYFTILKYFLSPAIFKRLR